MSDIDMCCPFCHKLALDSNTDNDSNVDVVVCHRTCLDWYDSWPSDKDGVKTNSPSLDVKYCAPK